jgi:hypothetical protein
MNYYNWRKIHAEAYRKKPKLKTLSIATHKSSTTLTNEEVRLTALAELERVCTVQQLDKLRQLAERFNKGELLD